MLVNPKNPQSEHKLNLSLKIDEKDFENFTYKDLPISFFASIISARRGGKSFLVNSIIQDFQKDKELKFTHIFLISPTDFGFEGIPPTYRFTNINAIDYITQNQTRIQKYNKELKDPNKRMKSRVLIVLDDMATDNSKSGLGSQTIMNLALNGRHFGTKDPVKNNGISIFLISQALKRIPRSVRLNQDAFFVNNISSLIERNDILDESFYIDTTKAGRDRGKKVFETLATSKDFRFIAILLHHQNKRKLEDYIKKADAVERKPFKFFGGVKDWSNDDFFK